MTTIETETTKITSHSNATVQVVQGDVVLAFGSSDSAVTYANALNPEAAKLLSDMIATSAGTRGARELAMTNGTWRCAPAEGGFLLEFEQDEQDTRLSVLVPGRGVALDLAAALAEAAEGLIRHAGGEAEDDS